MKKNKTTNNEKALTKDQYNNKKFNKNTEDNTKVEKDTGKRPENDQSPLPPNPNKIDNH